MEAVRVVVNPNWAELAMAEPGFDDAMNTIGGEILRDAQHVVPVDSGELLRSLTAEVVDGQIRVGSNKDYAKFVEEGTSRQKAQPYLSPALYKKRG